MESAAQRFYERNHQLSAVEDDVGIDEVNPGHRYHAAARILRQHQPRKVLEMGYGSAKLVRAIAPLTKGEYHIADIVARADAVTLPPNVRMHVANLDDRFPFHDGEFDCLIAMMVVEHLYDPFHSFAEIMRVTVPGAKVVMNLPNIASLRCRLQLLRGTLPITSSYDWFQKRQWDGNHLHYFVVDDVRRLAEANGMRMRELVPVGNKLGLKRLAPSLLCHEITYVFDRL